MGSHALTKRFTPTRVGRFCFRLWDNLIPPVHPHTRGEIDNARTPASINHGSPPHAWGDLGDPVRAVVNRRFTPTRVGRLFGDCDQSGDAAVHPHTRGEIEDLSDHVKTVTGSPPHAWGD